MTDHDRESLRRLLSLVREVGDESVWMLDHVLNDGNVADFPQSDQAEIRRMCDRIVEAAPRIDIDAAAEAASEVRRTRTMYDTITNPTSHERETLRRWREQGGTR